MGRPGVMRIITIISSKKLGLLLIDLRFRVNTLKYPTPGLTPLACLLIYCSGERGGGKLTLPYAGGSPGVGKKPREGGERH